VIVSVPHPGAFLLSLFGIRQIVHSWHFAVAQVTWLATALYSPKHSASRSRLASRLERAGLSLTDSRRYLNYLAGGGRFIGAIRWYQAMPFSPLRSSFFKSRNRVEILWGDADTFTGRLSIRLSRMFVSRGRLRVTVVPGGTHWLLDDHGDEIAQAVVRANAETSRA
jgi:pimeloyl-ACP methyl ester carboxylesterase